MLLRRSRNTQPLRYYLYISDTKLDMLFDQIDQGILKRISAEIKVDLKVASLTLRGADNPVPTRAAKLRIVERFIDLHHNVGTMSEPGQEYFRGQASMKWGNLRRFGGGRTLSAVAFVSADFSVSDAVLLVGSLYHVIGEGPPEIIGGASTYPNTTKILSDLYIRSESESAGSANTENPEQLLFLARAVWRYLSSGVSLEGKLAAQRLDFLAVPFAEYQSKGEDQRHVVLGTPLYVAMARLPGSG